jgi:predicted TIM-barrel fold metal-dependent hydrolase
MLEHDRMMGEGYRGSIIDTHHHLWDLSMERHPWLFSNSDGVKSLGDLRTLQRDYTVAHYLQDTAGQNLAASVHVEAHWDRTRSPIEETQWLESLDKTAGVAARYVAFAPLADPQVERILEMQTAFPRVAAVRETIRWHPDPAKRWTPPGLVNDVQWRRGLKLLGRFNLALDLMMGPYQAQEVAQLARDFPDQLFIVNHCGTPIDPDPDGLAFWREGLSGMGREPNIVIKISNFAAYAPNQKFETLRDVIMRCIDAFGVDRSMFGSNYPLSRRTMPFAQQCDVLRRVLSVFSADEQRAVFHDTAAAAYRIGQANLDAA